MATTKTRTELIEAAATELGVLTSGQELQVEDRDTIDAAIDSVRDQLSADNVVEIGDLEAIEPKYFQPLARLIANESAQSFGQQYSQDMKDENERQLRRLSAQAPTYEPIRVEYF